MHIDVLNVALVDDDKDDRFLFQEVIEEIKINTNLLLFTNGHEFMDYLIQEDTVNLHIVFLDLNMPVKNGIQCLDEIRSNNRFNDISVAIYSTSSSEADIEETFVKGANVYINKPNDFKSLKKTIEQVLRVNWQYNTSVLNRGNFLLKI